MTRGPSGSLVRWNMDAEWCHKRAIWPCPCAQVGEDTIRTNPFLHGAARSRACRYGNIQRRRTRWKNRRVVRPDGSGFQFARAPRGYLMKVSIQLLRKYTRKAIATTHISGWILSKSRLTTLMKTQLMKPAP